MKKAVIVLAHQLPEQVNIFLQQLIQDEQTDVYVHVNKLCEDIIPLLIKHKRVFITKNNVKIHWGDDGVLRAILLLYKEILQSKKTYEYVLIVSGQDLLVKNDIDSFLTKNKGIAFVEYKNINIKEQNSFNRAKLLYKWPYIFRQLYNNKFNPIRILRSLYCRLGSIGLLPKKKINYDVKNIIFYHDLFWNALPFEIVKYINDFLNDDPNFFDIFKNAFAPDETFFTTIIMNSKFKNRIKLVDNVSHSLTYINKTINNHPPILTMADVSKIEESGMFFARKFDYRVDKEVIEYFKNKIINSEGKRE